VFGGRKDAVPETPGDSQQPQRLGAYPAAQSPVPSAVSHLGPSASMVGGSGAIIAPRYPVFIPADKQAQARPNRPARGPAPAPPAYTEEGETRTHLIEVELEEVIIHTDEHFDKKPVWYESTSYFVSFHPESEPLETLPLPREAPRQTKNGEVLVSRTVAAKKPKYAHEKTKAEIPVAEFKESLSLTMDHLDVQFVVYVWGRKSSVANEDIVLVGRHVLPLRDYSIQRKKSSWDIFDPKGQRPAELVMKFQVMTTPSEVVMAYLADVKQTEVTLHWSAPLNDHGSPLLGYEISMLLTKGDEGQQWITLCECTKTLSPIWVVTNLVGNTSYLVCVRAVNKVGPGDPCEIQMQTAPTEPSPPSKPWIQEVRDGCLCIAWKASATDGGTPITAYKIKMRKILGASKWNLFGPSAANAAWVDMGTVGAVMDENQETMSVYTAWVGPLEEVTCEYRFQAVALNLAGTSEGSELSDSHYTSAPPVAAVAK